MVTTARAALAVLMLAGFYVFALALIGALGWFGLWALDNGSSRAGSQAIIACAIAAFALVAGLWRMARAKPEPPSGVVLTPTDAPELWATVTELARAADTRPPDEIRLIPEVNAAVQEDARLLGLVAGTRRLFLGVPLVMALDVAQVRSVLGHELGHYSRAHTRLGPITYRGQIAIFSTIHTLARSVVGWVLRGYAWLYVLVSAGVTRRQELEADRVSVRVAGREVARSALLELPVVDAAWGFYESAYVAPGWESGVAPTAEGFFGGFGALLAARTDELDRIRAEAPPAKASWSDTHPPIAARVALMEREPDVDLPRDTRPATSLVPGFETRAARLADEVVNWGDRRRVGWDELTAAAVGAEEQRAADTAYRAAARLAGVPTGTLGTVLDLLAAGRGPELAAQLGLRPEDERGTAPLLREVVLTVLRASAVQAGAARWQHSWSGPAGLVAPDGSAVDLGPVADLAMDPARTTTARTHLAALGVDVTAAGQASERATAHGAQVITALGNVSVDGESRDVVVLDRGLVIAPCPKRKDGAKARLADLVSSTPPIDLAGRHRFVPFEDVADAVIRKRTPLAADLVLHDGRTVTLKEAWTGENLTKDASQTLLGILQSLQAVAAQP